MSFNLSLNGPINLHSFNHDKSQVAICQSDNQIHIYQVGTTKLLQTLSEHTMRITALDWHPQTDLLLTCSMDRNAYVWQRKEGIFVPSMVLLRTNRAANCAHWNVSGDAFAVALAQSAIAICTYDTENDWWISRHVKMNGCVMSVAWHPNNELLVYGMIDGTFGVVDLQGQPIYTKDEINKELSYVHDTSFSPEGTYFAVLRHDGQLIISDCQQEWQVMASKLPMKKIAWISENKLVLVGYDDTPFVCSFSGNKWTATRANKMGKESTPATAGIKAAMSKFQGMSLEKMNEPEREIINSVIVMNNQLVTCGAINGELSQWQV